MERIKITLSKFEKKESVRGKESKIGIESWRMWPPKEEKSVVFLVFWRFDLRSEGVGKFVWRKSFHF